MSQALKEWALTPEEKEIFALLWARATEAQKTSLKTIYETKKEKLS